MAEREEQAAETNAAAATSEILGRSAPVASRKQQGYGKDGSSLYRDAEAERLALLKKENMECRRKREKEEERRKKHQHEMAEAWKQHLQEDANRKREERKVRLAKLQAQTDERLARQAQKKEETLVYDDPEYHMLLEKYGDRVRVPGTLARLALDDKRHNESMESSRSLPRKPRVPKSMTRTGEPDRISAVPKPGSLGQTAAKPSNDGTYGTLPPLSAGSGKGVVDTLASDSTEELSEPERSLMPRKDRLRKMQQAMLRRTNVSFYKTHLKRHLRRILEVTEVTFSDNNARREQATWNLAKPLSIAEIKQLNGVGVRQP